MTLTTRRITDGKIFLSTETVNKGNGNSGNGKFGNRKLNMKASDRCAQLM